MKIVNVASGGQSSAASRLDVVQITVSANKLRAKNTPTLGRSSPLPEISSHLEVQDIGGFAQTRAKNSYSGWARLGHVPSTGQSLGTSQEAFSVLIKVLLGGGLAVSLALPGCGGAMKLGRVLVVLAVVHRH